MLHHFLAEQTGVIEKKYKIIKKMFLRRRKYNPFHLDCSYTKRKLCYCKKNPIAKMSEGQKAELWRNSYMQPNQFYQMEAQQRVKNQQNDSEVNANKTEPQFASHEIEAAGRHLQICLEKIKLLSQEQLANFIRQRSKKARRAIVESEQYQ